MVFMITGRPEPTPIYDQMIAERDGRQPGEYLKDDAADTSEVSELSRKVVTRG